MNVIYEWFVETKATVDSDDYETGEVVGHCRFATYALAAEFATTDAGHGFRYVVALVRDDDDEGRSWAYVNDGTLPVSATDATGFKYYVPRRYREEVSQYRDRPSV